MLAATAAGTALLATLLAGAVAVPIDINTEHRALFGSRGAEIPYQAGGSATQQGAAADPEAITQVVHHINNTITPSRCGETTVVGTEKFQQYTASFMDKIFNQVRGSRYGLAAGTCASVGYTLPAKPGTWGSEDLPNTQTWTQQHYQYGKTGYTYNVKFFVRQVKLQAGLFGYLNGNSMFSTLAAAITAADLIGALSSGSAGEFTLFAPTNAAFTALGSAAVATLLKPENKALLVKVMKYHVIHQHMESKTWSESNVMTLEGQSISFVGSTRPKHRVSRKICANGVPVDNNLPSGIKGDIRTTNGHIFAIDRVLLFPGFKLPGGVTFQTPQTLSCGPLPDGLNVFGFAAGQPTLSTLVVAVKAAGLTHALSTLSPLTVLAPTNAAFAALGSAVPALLKPQNKALLIKVLQYHVIVGTKYVTNGGKGDDVHSIDRSAPTVATTLEGQDITFVDPGGNIDRTKVTVIGSGSITDGANISQSFMASNGVVHVIDKVLLYPGFKLPTPLPPGTCITDKSFFDKYGTCATYETNLWCKDGHVGPFWQTTWGTLSAPVLQACCVCGGGSISSR